MRPVPLPCELYEAIDSKEAIVLIRSERMNILSKTITKGLYDYQSSASLCSRLLRLVNLRTHTPSGQGKVSVNTECSCDAGTERLNDLYLALGLDIQFTSRS